MGEQAEPRMLVLGHISGVYGVRGWVKVFSETAPRENILRYSPWYLGEPRSERQMVEGRRHGKGVVARIEGCDTRDEAASLVGLDIAVRRDQLPPPSSREFYWADLEGLEVENMGGTPLGRVDRLFSTAANDVVVVKGQRERLLPFIWDDVIRDIDIERRLMRVDWDPDF